MDKQNTTFCHICNTNVTIIDTVNQVNYDEHYLSCGHMQKVNNQRLDKTQSESQQKHTSKDELHEQSRFDNSIGTIEDMPLQTEEIQLKDNDVSATCTICGLTARNKQELDQHISNAHRSKEAVEHERTRLRVAEKNKVAEEERIVIDELENQGDLKEDVPLGGEEFEDEEPRQG
jgi:hypothetical protein